MQFVWMRGGGMAAFFFHIYKMLWNGDRKENEIYRYDLLCLKKVDKLIKRFWKTRMRVSLHIDSEDRFAAPPRESCKILYLVYIRNYHIASYPFCMNVLSAYPCLGERQTASGRIWKRGFYIYVPTPLFRFVRFVL